MFRKIIGGVGFLIIVFLLLGSIEGLIFYQTHPNNLSQLSDPSIECNSEKYTEKESPTEDSVSNNFRYTPFEYMYPVNPKIRPPLASIKSSAPTSKKSDVTTGTVKIAVLLVGFSNVSFDSAHNSNYYANLIFNHSNPKSVASYYWENSYGQLNITGEIIGGIYLSSHTSRYWGEDSASGNVFPQVDDKNDYIYNLVVEGVQLADPNVNFTRFDVNRDSIVDYLLVVHAGDAQESTGVSNHIWSHRWSVQTKCVVDRVVVKDYTMCAETSPMGTFAHELGHAIGNLPDLYDTDYSSDGIGRWGLMGAGAWNYNDTLGSGEKPGDTPAHFCAWSKIKMGWLIPTIVTTNLFGKTLPAIETSNHDSVMKIFLSNDTNSVSLREYFLVCFRNQTGFDSALPGSGILIWHIDECNIYEGNDGEKRKLVDLEEADAIDPMGIIWEQLDYYHSQPGGVQNPDDEGNITDPWSPGTVFSWGSAPNSDSNDGIKTYINISVNTLNEIDISVAYDPFPWDYTLFLMDQTAININDDEPSIIEHSSGSFSVVWQTNRTGDWDIYGSQTGDAGQTWSSAIPITSNSSDDYSPSLIYWYPPAYWARTFVPDIVSRPIPAGDISLNTQPPLHYIVAFVSDRTGNPEIFITISPDFKNNSWSQPVQITNDSAYDLDPCLIQTPSGDLGLFWASNRTGNYEIYFIEEPWNTSNIVQVTNNLDLDRGPSYCLSQNNTHLVAFERKVGGTSNIHLLSSTDLTSWISSSITCTNPLVDSTEPSLVEREDGSLLIAFTQTSGSNEKICQVISSNWINWSPHLVMGIPKNASSPSLIEAKCGALFMAYTTYDVNLIPHVYLIHTTLCYRFGVGIDYPRDTGTSFFNPSHVEQGSNWVFTGEMRLNLSDAAIPANNASIVVTDTRNTWDESDDEIIFNIQLKQEDYPQFLPILDPVIGVGAFTIPLDEFQVHFGKLPTGTILHFRIGWFYKDFNEQSKNITGSIYIELLIPQDHIQFEGNIPTPTTVDYPLSIQAPIIQGYVNYGVESVTLALYDTADEPPPLPENGLHSQPPFGSTSKRNIVSCSQKAISNAIVTLYSQQTIVFTELTKVKGVWTTYLPNLRDDTITRVVATSNGIYPRKTAELFVQKSPWDTNPPQLIHIKPITTQTEEMPIVFSEQITDDQGVYNYGIDNTSVTFSYNVLNNQESWIEVSYSASDPNWSKIGNIYNYTLSLSESDDPIYITYYWSASDLAYPSNHATDGNQETPYYIGIYQRETEIYTTTITDITTKTLQNTTTITVPTTVSLNATSVTSTTSATTKPGPAIGFEFLVIIGTLGTTIVVCRKKRH
ncbi:MAG: M6 family metalloprotease domain-containing protein [Promethearchaeota archaeon]